MILYTLRCSSGHVFESWFRDSSAFEALSADGRVACAVCGDREVDKSVMAPAVRGGGGEPGKAVAEAPAPETAAGKAESGALDKPAGPAEQALTRLRTYLEKNVDYVGRGFAAEARRIKDGDAQKRAIWGEATPADAKALRDEGVPVAPLPWLSRRDD